MKPDHGVCPGCKRTYKVPYLYQHMRSEHGIFGGASGRRRYETSMSTTRSTDLVPVEHPKVRPDADGIRVLENFQVVTDGKRLGVLQWVIDNAR